MNDVMKSKQSKSWESLNNDEREEVHVLIEKYKSIVQTVFYSYGVLRIVLDKKANREAQYNIMSRLLELLRRVYFPEACWGKGATLVTQLLTTSAIVGALQTHYPNGRFVRHPVVVPMSLNLDLGKSERMSLINGTGGLVKSKRIVSINTRHLPRVVHAITQIKPRHTTCLD